MVARLHERFSAPANWDENVVNAACNRFWVRAEKVAGKWVAIAKADIVKEPVILRNFNHDSRTLVVVAEIAFNEIVVATVVKPKAGPNVVGELVVSDTAMIKPR